MHSAFADSGVLRRQGRYRRAPRVGYLEVRTVRIFLYCAFVVYATGQQALGLQSVPTTVCATRTAVIYRLPDFQNGTHFLLRQPAHEGVVPLQAALKR